MRSSAVNVDLAVTIPAIKDVGLKASAASNVPYVNSFVGKEAGNVEEGSGNGDAPLIGEVGLCNHRAVNFR
jgi:hypothetical protein